MKKNLVNTGQRQKIYQICNFKPSFSTETRQQWANKFDSKKIADKIIKNTKEWNANY